MYGIEELLNRARELGASDLHLTVASPPAFRIDGNLVIFPEDTALTSDDTRCFTQQIISEERMVRQLQEEGQLDFALTYAAAGRVRISVYLQKGYHALAIRLLPGTIPELDELGLPAVVRDLALKETGLVLVVGPAGSGKSTTLAAMLNMLNKQRNLHAITLEDPIEYLHEHGQSLINQREVGSDTRSFVQGLRAALRQDPDVILVGEMRDLETISTVITAAETGHLVLSSLHSTRAVQAIDRIIDVFPAFQQPQLRIQLAAALQGVISQQLVPRQDGTGRVVAVEVLVATPAVRNLIREGRTQQLYSQIQTGSAWGMVTMEKSLQILWEKGLISTEELTRRAATGRPEGGGCRGDKR